MKEAAWPARTSERSKGRKALAIKMIADVSVAPLPRHSPIHFVTKASAPHGIYDHTTLVSRTYLATPRLRGSGGALVIVNAVVIAQGEYGRTQKETALALAAFGGGSMVVALALLRLLEFIPD